MKRILDVSPKYVLSLCAVLIVALAILGNDPDRSKYYVQDALLSESRAQSQALDFALLKTRAGLNQDYDELVQFTQLLAATTQRFTNNLNIESGSNNRRAATLTKQQAGEFYAESSALNSTLQQRMANIDKFKSEFVIYRQSRTRVFELIDQLRSFITPHQNWQAMVAELERLALQSDRLETAGNEYELFPLVDQLKMQSFTEAQKNSLTELELHLRNVAQYLPRIQLLVEESLALSGGFNATLTQLKEKLTTSHDRAVKSSAIYYAALIIVALLTIVYGVLQALRTVRHSSQIEQQNRTLEANVAQRTEELSSLLSQLQAETAEKQKIIEDLNSKDEEMETREAFFRSITETAADPIILINNEGYITFANSATYEVFDKEQYRVLGDSISTLLPEISNAAMLLERDDNLVVGENSAGEPINLRYSIKKIDLDVDDTFFAVIMHDMTSFVQMEADLAHAQKLESVGQLAAGIAHEINTPAQFISDNLSFLIDSVGEIFELVDEISKLVSDDSEIEELAEINQLIEDADVEYLTEEVPSALQQSAEGIQRVATIVKAMKDYSHPGENMDFADVNSAIQSTITVSRGEWKYLAELETNFDENLPLVQCVVSDVNQIVLNMVVNSAHAIADKFAGEQDKTGLIKVATQAADEHIVITISDNGNGMPEHVKEKIFDHFFTTKGVGKGTGQGLSIAHKLVTQKHHGSIAVDSVEGEGTTFTIKLPLKQAEKETDTDAELFEEQPRKAG